MHHTQQHAGDIAWTRKVYLLFHEVLVLDEHEKVLSTGKDTVLRGYMYDRTNISPGQAR